MPVIIRASKSEKTLKKYSYGFQKFKVWCTKYNLPFLPATVNSLALYLSFLIQTRVSTSVLNAAFYAIKWEHDMNLYEEAIFKNKLVKMIMDGGEKLLSKPISKKEPITPEILKNIVSKFSNRNSLKDLRICCISLISYAGFLRFDELSHLQVKHVKFFSSHLEITLEKSKTDVYRKGNLVIISRTEKETCPVKMLETYFKTADLDGVKNKEEFIFRPLSFFKSKNTHKLCKVNKPISYTRAREIVLEALELLGLDKKQFGLHSFRSGGASQAASENVPDRLFKSHGRWRSEKAKDGYIKESLKNKLVVTKNLGI